ncbi:MAG TPA: polysaccharide deacetylase family protein [Deinococcales bacterium]|nr:polysaccharide deacetylase family protein [Deinococcales bacterium]
MSQRAPRRPAWVPAVLAFAAALAPFPAPAGSAAASPPGAVQPLAPGTVAAQALPELTLVPPLREARSVAWAGNGRIEVAHALLLAPQAALTRTRLLALAQAAAGRTFRARATLAEVDVSVFLADTYAGPGGPLPAFTASVPRDRLAAFLALTPGTLDDFERLWLNPTPQAGGPDLTPTGALERDIQPGGTPAELTALKALNVHALARGGSSGGLILRGPSGATAVALTFDDAPHPLYEPLLLDDLKAAGAHATFFIIGRNARAYPYFLRDMLQAGHELANHTYHHVRLSGLSASATAQELSLANQVIREITGQAPRYFRPPGGRYTATTLHEAGTLGLTTAFWTDDPADYTNRPGEATETLLQKALRPGGIVLLHDNVLQTILELPDFLRDEARVGLRLETLSTLAGN